VNTLICIKRKPEFARAPDDAQVDPDRFDVSKSPAGSSALPTPARSARAAICQVILSDLRASEPK
jgi:hypothetical protein